jgi:AcrR family transcriptional regulator
VTLEAVGQLAGVPQGTASLHFGSKEELFFQVVAGEVRAWCEALQAGLAKRTKALDAHGLAVAISRSLAGRPRLTRLLAVLPVAMEQSVDAIALGRAGDLMAPSLSALAHSLEETSSDLDPGEGRALLRRVWVLVAGLDPLARPRGGLSLAVDEVTLARGGTDLETELREMLEALVLRRR